MLGVFCIHTVIRNVMKYTNMYGYYGWAYDIQCNIDSSAQSIKPQYVDSDYM